jgi:deoxyuridine 5'-triphosphate nucleotidohydrolase
MSDSTQAGPPAPSQPVRPQPPTESERKPSGPKSDLPGRLVTAAVLVPNAPGTIDSDYRGEVRVILLNTGEKSYPIRRGDRIAQLVIAPVTHAEFCECDQLEVTDRGEGGFGHSGRVVRGSES